jgi:hypothetical protein
MMEIPVWTPNRDYEIGKTRHPPSIRAVRGGLRTLGTFRYD